MDLSYLVGARCVGTFVDRGGRTVLNFEKKVAVGEGPTWRWEKIHNEIRIEQDGIATDT